MRVDLTKPPSHLLVCVCLFTFRPRWFARDVTQLQNGHSHAPYLDKRRKTALMARPDDLQKQNDIPYRTTQASAEMATSRRWRGGFQWISVHDHLSKCLYGIWPTIVFDLWAINWMFFKKCNLKIHKIDYNKLSTRKTKLGRLNVNNVHGIMNQIPPSMKIDQQI